jgi:hypothetical protein
MNRQESAGTLRLIPKTSSPPIHTSAASTTGVIVIWP